MTRQSYKDGDKVIIIKIEWVDNEHEKTVDEHRIT